MYNINHLTVVEYRDIVPSHAWFSDAFIFYRLLECDWYPGFSETTTEKLQYPKLLLAA